jgi:hypothetical protein
MAAEHVSVAVREALGLPAEAVVPVSPEDAAAAVVDELHVLHEHDLADGHSDTHERVAAKFGPAILHDPRALIAIDDVLHADGMAHEVARDVVGRDLLEAFSGPAGERERRVAEILERERARVQARARTRAARATRNLLAAVRLPDAALEPLGGLR